MSPGCKAGFTYVGALSLLRRTFSIPVKIVFYTIFLSMFIRLSISLYYIYIVSYIIFISSNCVSLTKLGIVVLVKVPRYLK